jgi:hypothetical protein
MRNKREEKIKIKRLRTNKRKTQFLKKQKSNNSVSRLTQLTNLTNLTNLLNFQNLQILLSFHTY